MSIFAASFVGRRRARLLVGSALSALLLSAASSAQSVDPKEWVKADLLSLNQGIYTYDHRLECAMRDEGAQPNERVLARVRATAPETSISRDQLIALIQRMETAFALSIGQGFRPEGTAMAMVSMLDCRPRKGSAKKAERELLIEVNDSGFISEFLDHATGVSSKHAETWPEAFRP